MSALNKTLKSKSDLLFDAPTFLELLRSTPLFRNISEEALHDVSKKITEKEYLAGDPVFIEHEVSRFIYLVKNGSFEIKSYNRELRKLAPIRRLNPSDYFSELSALTGTQHTTSCYALEKSMLFAIEHQTFLDALSKSPQMARDLVTSLAETNHQLATTSNLISHFKSEDVIFSPEITTILPYHFLERYGVIPIRLNKASLSVGITNPYNRIFFERFHTLNPQLELHLSLIDSSAFSFMLKKMQELYLNSKGFSASPLQMPIQHQTPKVPSALQALRCSPLFSLLDDSFLMQIASHIPMRRYKTGESIFKQGDPADSLYIVAEGEIALTRTSSTGQHTASILTSTGSFGEISILTRGNHALSAHATQTSTLYSLPSKMIQDLLENTSFSISLAKILASRLQTANHHNRWQYHSEGSLQVASIRTDILPKAVICDHQVLPLSTQGNSIVIGVVNFHEEGLYQILNRYLSGYQVTFEIISQSDFDRTMSLFEIHMETPLALTQTPMTVIGPENVRDPVHFANGLLKLGIELRASDIHIDPCEGGFSIRFRTDGTLREVHDRIDVDLGQQLVGRIKVLSKMNISERRLPQDGYLVINVEDVGIQARVSTVPTKLGEKIVMRLIHSQRAPIPLDMLAPDSDAIRFLKDMTRFQQGIFLVTGPTGSGKTTTLYSILNELNNIRDNIITVEDPVEFILTGTNQIQINDNVGLSFVSILRNVLRQDPDIIMIGEIRDAESAQIAFNAALTGHLVFSTLHTNDSIDVITRLHELGVHSSTLANGLIGVIAQRLLPQICPVCQYQRPATVFEHKVLDEALGEAVEMVTDGRGCPKCFGEGFLGRIPVFEYWNKSPLVRKLILNPNVDSEELRAALTHEGFYTMGEFGMRMVRNGLTTVEQVERYLYGMERKSRHSSPD